MRSEFSHSLTYTQASCSVNTMPVFIFKVSELNLVFHGGEAQESVVIFVNSFSHGS